MPSVIQRLGFSPDDRVVVVHADDIGMCQATLPAFAELVEVGLVSSAAVMIPCPWFPAAAAFCHAHPHIDVGVHLTLNCEWDAYRWGPLSTRDPAVGLLDEEGYFPRSPADVQAKADVPAVRCEAQAQVERALAAGLDITHIDTHMGTLAHPRFTDIYVNTALQQQVPPLLFRVDEQRARAQGWDDEMIAFATQATQQFDHQGLILFDDITGMPLDDPADRIAVAKRIFDRLPPGLSLLILHPAKDTPELRAIASDWRSRVADYEAFTSPELRDYVRDAGIHVIGYRPLRELMRSTALSSRGPADGSMHWTG